LASFVDHLDSWHSNEQAFLASFDALQLEVVERQLVLDRVHASIAGYRFVLHAEIRPHGSLEVLASLDVGLGEDGSMLVQSSPGHVTTSLMFTPMGVEFYRQKLRSLVNEAAFRLGS
jgi:hypothetical protein